MGEHRKRAAQGVAYEDVGSGYMEQRQLRRGVYRRRPQGHRLDHRGRYGGGPGRPAPPVLLGVPEHPEEDGKSRLIKALVWEVI